MVTVRAWPVERPIDGAVSLACWSEGSVSVVVKTQHTKQPASNKNMTVRVKVTESRYGTPTPEIEVATPPARPTAG